ncbi:MAG: hypothetical protein JSU73_04995 [candidate division WOR-3 bacterium]|nr:MAG: hypothetical protein JSU73_04995 [candidate division WOR-3 bacterium]
MRQRRYTMAFLTLLGNICLVIILPANVWTAPKDLWDGLAPIQEEAEAHGVPKALRLVRGMPKQWWAWMMLRDGLPDSSRIERSYAGGSSTAERPAERFDLQIVQRDTAVRVSYGLRTESRADADALLPLPAGRVSAAAYRDFLAPLAHGWFFASDTAYSPGKPGRGTVRIAVTCWKGRRTVSHSVVAGVDHTPRRVAKVLAGVKSLEMAGVGPVGDEDPLGEKARRSRTAGTTPADEHQAARSL